MLASVLCWAGETKYIISDFVFDENTKNIYKNIHKNILCYFVVIMHIKGTIIRSF